MLEWEGGRKAQDDRIRGLENQKKALIEKNDLMQVLLLISNRRPSRKCNQSEERGGGGVEIQIASSKLSFGMLTSYCV